MREFPPIPRKSCANTGPRRLSPDQIKVLARVDQTPRLTEQIAELVGLTPKRTYAILYALETVRGLIKSSPSTINNQKLVWYRKESI